MLCRLWCCKRKIAFFAKDPDILYNALLKNAKRMLSVLADFGSKSSDITLEGLTTIGRVIQLAFNLLPSCFELFASPYCIYTVFSLKGIRRFFSFTG